MNVIRKLLLDDKPALPPYRLGFVVPADFLRFLYILIFTLNGVLILAAILWDLASRCREDSDN